MARELKGIEIEGLGRTLVYPSGAEEDVQDILEGREYPISLVELDRVERIVDVGAHVGMATVFFTRSFQMRTSRRLSLRARRLSSWNETRSAFPT